MRALGIAAVAAAVVVAIVAHFRYRTRDLEGDARSCECAARFDRELSELLGEGT